MWFEPVADAAAILSGWIRWFDEGRQRPLPLLCDASRVYAEHCIGGATRDEALVKARKAFLRAPREGVPPGESFDAYVALVARGRDLLDADFEARARALFDPLLSHREFPG